MEVNGVPIVEPSPGSSSGAVSLAEDFDTFLTLLTTQLEHQDPLSPLDTTEFTNQLTSFAQVEQAINTNSKLDRLIDLQGITDLTTGVGYIGMVAEATGDKLILEDGQGRIGYELTVDSARTTITVVDQFGVPVLSTSGNTGAGRHIFDWNGVDEVGNELQDGVYSVIVSAFDGNDDLLDSSTTTFGTVTGVESADGEVTLIMGPLSVDIGDVHSVQAPETDEDEG